MPLNPQYLPTASVIEEDRAVLRAIMEIPNYAPHNPEHNLTSLLERESNLTQAQNEAERARRAYDAARQRLIQESWLFHNGVGGAKTEITAQFGADSPVMHAIGLKKKSEHKRGSRRAKTAAE